MHSDFDPTGFPLLFVPEQALFVHLLPVTRTQFRAFVEAAGDEVDVEHWRPLCQHSRAAAWEDWFVTGVLPEESQAFARWLGDGYRLPTLEEWRAIYMELALREEGQPSVPDLLDSPGDEARACLHALWERSSPRTLFQFMSLEGGLVEWVRRDQEWVGVGRPRAELQPNLWNPLQDEIVPVRQGERVRYFGFRLVRRGFAT